MPAWPLRFLTLALLALAALAPGAGAQTLVANPTALSFDFVRGDTTTKSAVISLRNDPDGSIRWDSISVFVAYSGDEDERGWLTVPATLPDPTPTALRVSVAGSATSGLPIGTHQALVAISGVSTATLERESAMVTVTLRVFPAPGIGISRTAVDFNVYAGEPLPAAVALGLFSLAANDPNGVQGMTARVEYGAGGSGWLDAVLTRTATPAQLRLSADPEGLVPLDDRTPRLLTAIVRLASQDPVDSAVVTVRLLVAPARGVITLSEREVTLVQGEGAPTVAADTVHVVHGGPGSAASLRSLRVSVSYDGARTGWLDARLDRNFSPARLILRPAAVRPPRGTYTARVTVSDSTSRNGSETVDVALVVGEPGRVTGDRSDLTMTLAQGDTSTTTIALSSDDGSTLAGLEVRTRTLNGGSEWLTAALTDTRTPASVVITTRAGALPAGSYTGFVDVTAAGGAGSSALTIPVTLTVSASDTVRLHVARADGARLTDGTEMRPLGPVLLTGTGRVAVDTVEHDGVVEWLAATIVGVDESGRAPAHLRLVPRDDLAQGVYTARVRVDTWSGRLTLPVRLVVRGGAVTLGELERALRLGAPLDATAEVWVDVIGNRNDRVDLGDFLALRALSAAPGASSTLRQP